MNLPERSTDNIISFLETNNMPVRVPDKESGGFNCWGFTAWYFQWERDALWLERSRMEDHLKTHTKPINPEEAKAGDIAVFCTVTNYLTHTAIVMPGSGIICHKPGMTALCIDTIDAAERSYGAVTYARAIEKDNGVLTSVSEPV